MFTVFTISFRGKLMKVLKNIWKEKKKVRYFPKLVLKFAKIKLVIEALCLGFEVLTALVMERIVFWDISECSLLIINQRFGGIYRLHLQC
jgi:hypothetical protein